RARFHATLRAPYRRDQEKRNRDHQEIDHRNHVDLDIERASPPALRRDIHSSHRLTSAMLEGRIARVIGSLMFFACERTIALQPNRCRFQTHLVRHAEVHEAAVAAAVSDPLLSKTRFFPLRLLPIPWA